MFAEKTVILCVCYIDGHIVKVSLSESRYDEVLSFARCNGIVPETMFHGTDNLGRQFRIELHMGVRAIYCEDI